MSDCQNGNSLSNTSTPWNKSKDRLASPAPSITISRSSKYLASPSLQSSPSIRSRSMSRSSSFYSPRRRLSSTKSFTELLTIPKSNVRKNWKSPMLTSSRSTLGLQTILQSGDHTTIQLKDNAEKLQKDTTHTEEESLHTQKTPIISKSSNVNLKRKLSLIGNDVSRDTLSHRKNLSIAPSTPNHVQIAKRPRFEIVERQVTEVTDISPDRKKQDGFFSVDPVDLIDTSTVTETPNPKQITSYTPSPASHQLTIVDPLETPRSSLRYSSITPSTSTHTPGLSRYSELRRSITRSSPFTSLSSLITRSPSRLFTRPKEDDEQIKKKRNNLIEIRRIEAERKARLEREERERKEREKRELEKRLQLERERKAREERERQERERKEQEERIRKEKEEKERLERLEREKKEQAEKERLRREKEERDRKQKELEESQKRKKEEEEAASKPTELPKPAETSSTAASTDSEPKKPLFGGFTLPAPASNDSKNPTPSTTKPLFSFGSTPATSTGTSTTNGTTTTTATTNTTTNGTSAPTNGFKFNFNGASNPSSTTNTSSSSTTAPGFTFGKPTTGTSSTENKTSNGSSFGFNFGSSNSNTSAAPTLFGGNSTTNNSSANTLNNGTTAPTTSFSFSSQPNFNFISNEKKADPASIFGFGNKPSSATSTTPSSSTGFSFGANKPSTTPASTGFSFGASNNNNNSNGGFSFGSSNNSNGVSGNTTVNNTVNGTSTPGGMFSFNASNTSSTPPAPVQGRKLAPLRRRLQKPN